MKRLLVLAVLVLGGVASAQPVPSPGLRKVTHDSTLTGAGTLASALGLAPCGSPGQTWVWNGSAFACGSAGGTVTNVSTLAPLQGGPITTTGTVSLINCAANQIYKMNGGGTAWACGADVGFTNGAGANILMKSDGTNAVSSTWTDNGTTTTTTGNVSVNGNTTLGTTNANTTTVNGRETVNADSSGYATIAQGSTSDTIVDISNSTPSTGRQYLLDSQSGGIFAITDGTASAARVTIGSTGNVNILTGSLDLGTHQIHSVTDPTSAQDAATKNYVDSTAIPAAVTGTSGNLARFSGAHVVGNANATDDLTTFTIASGTPSVAVTESTAKTVINSAASPADDQLTLKAAGLGSLGLLSFAADNQQILFDEERVGGSTLARSTSTGAFGKVSGMMRWFGKTGATVNAAVTAVDIMDLDLGSGILSAAGGYNCSLNVNASATCKLNAGGYLNGTTQFRDLEIDDGKGNLLATFSGVNDTLSVSQTKTGQATNLNGVSVSDTASFDTTATTRTTYGEKITNTNTLSAGTNTLTSVALDVSNTSSGANINPFAFVTETGDNVFNNTTGKSTFKGLLAASGGNGSTDAIQAFNSTAGQAASNNIVNVSSSGSFDTTASGRTAIGVNANVTATRSTGANNLTNTALYGNATGGQVNIGLQTDSGDVKLTQVAGNLYVGGTAPTLSSCGTSPTITGHNGAGIITTGTSATSCTVTFAGSGFSAEPSCVIMGNDGTVGTLSFSAKSSTAFTFTRSSTGFAGDKFSYICMGI